MLTTSPFVNLVMVVIISYIVLVINIKILKKILFPVLFFLILLYYLGPVELKQKLNNFSLEIMGINKKIDVCKFNVADKFIDYQKLNNKVNNLIEKINNGNYNESLNSDTSNK